MKGLSRSGLTYFCLQPAELPGSSIALAATHAGQVGVLDVTRCDESELERRWAEARDPLGLRMTAEQALWFSQRGSDPPLGPIVVGDVDPLRHEPLARAAELLRARRYDVWLELPSLPVLQAIGAQSRSIAAGYVVRGQEVGGLCGESSAMVLLQAALQSDLSPVLVHGGMGVGGIGACRAAGAAGVVLDDQLLLLRDSPLAPDQKALLEGFRPEASLLLGTTLDAPCRVLQHPRFRLTKALRDQAIACEAGASALPVARDDWLGQVKEKVGFRACETSLWPIGHGLEFAAGFRESYRTVGRLLAAIERETRSCIESAATVNDLAPGSLMATRLGTTYPIVQGPMTRVSDKVEFARAVADAGALPSLALGVMRADEVEELLSACRERLGSSPWAAGLLGFLEPEILDQHIDAVIRGRPTHVILAGGHSTQVQLLESAGIKTFVHVASPSGLDRFVSAGVRRFIFEGRECGGHVGPVTSLVLWEACINRLVELGGDELAEFEILFAGGIHDALSAGMALIVAQPLIDRGGAWGELMGSAYVYTEEAVTCGALVEGFQRAALDCRRTVTIESSPGHANRCADTPFVGSFADRRRSLLGQSPTGDQLRADLDKLLLGRLRIASKGMVRASGGLSDVSPEEQRRDGMFMIGDCAVLKDATMTLEQLHQAVTIDAAQWLSRGTRKQDQAAIAGTERSQPSDVAIIGIGMLAPGADGIEPFWDSVLRLQAQFREIPTSRWDWRFFDDPEGTDPDASVCRWGCFIDPIVFDPLKFKIPPRSIRNIVPAQLMMLEMTHRALADAGYEGGDFDRENTAVIFGAADASGFIGDALRARAMAPLVVGSHADLIKERTPELSDETFAGGLTSIVAGRVANRFDCGGPNLTVDAACASGLSAMDIGVQALEAGRANLALVGAVDLGQNPGSYTGFSRTGALSPTGTERVFDQAANGFVPSEAAVVMVLKRLGDARRDGDRVYAVIKAIAGSSDGRAKGMTAPHPAGQIRAMRRAYLKAGLSPSTIGLYEAHGTGTRVGDQAEVESYSSLLRDAGGAHGSCTLGSLKSLFGHAKTCSAMLGMAKAALSLYHRVLPGHAGTENPISPLADAETPLRLYDRPRPWLAANNGVRRAAVSAFGFGGTNSHAVLEEFPEEIATAPRTGTPVWPHELFVFQGQDREQLIGQIAYVRTRLEQGAEPQLRDLAAACAEAAASAGSGRGWVATAVVESSRVALQDALTELEAGLRRGPGAVLPPNLGYEFRDEQPAADLGLLFPGQGAQYLGMGREAALCFADVHYSLCQTFEALQGLLPLSLADYLFPPQAFEQGQRDAFERALTDTRVAQPAIGAVSASYLALLKGCLVQPVFVAGHSFGELTALYASGALTLASFMRIAATRGELMGSVAADGSMAAVFAARDVVERELADRDDVVVANHNAERQVVISGRSAAVEAVCGRLSDLGIHWVPLRVSSAFHSPLMQEARVAFAEYLNGLHASTPELPVFSNLNGSPIDPSTVLAGLPRQLTEPVEFVAMIKTMIDQGARVLVDVGPMDTVASLLRAMPVPDDVRVISLDAGRQGLQSLLRGIGELWRVGYVHSFRPLFAGRVDRVRSIGEVLDSAFPEPLHSSIWYVDGQVAWQTAGTNGPESSVGRWPAAKALYDLDGVEKERSEAAARTQPSDRNGFERQPLATDMDLGKAYQLYSENMRSFIASQERMLLAMIGAESVAQSGDFHPPLAPHLLNELSRDRAPPQQAARPAAQRAQPTPAARQQTPAPSAGGRRGRVDDARRTQEVDNAELPDPVAFLMDTVSRITGYPPDILDPEADMESELGVESLKRIEIVESVMRAFPALTERGTEQLSRIRTLRAWADALTELETEAPAADTPSLAGASPADRLAPADRQQLLLRIVSEVTGYPEDLLGTEQDLEADFGIDSLRRIEIAERFGESVSKASTIDLRECLPKLGRLRTLAEWVRYVVDLEQENDNSTELQTTAEAGSEARRYLMQAREVALPQTPLRFRGCYLLSRDRLGVADLLAELIVEYGGLARVVDIGADNGIAEVLAWLEQSGHEVRGLLHLAGLDRSDRMAGIEAWRSGCEAHVKRLFTWLKQIRPFVAASAAADTTALLSASMLGGRFGRSSDQSPLSVTGGAALGILKSLQYEWPGLRVSGVDFDPAMEPNAIASALAMELGHDVRDQEVGYASGARLVFEPVAVPAPTGPGLVDFRLPAGGVLVATGGARGITSVAVKALVQEGVHVVLVGRREVSDDSEPGAHDADAAARLRLEIIERDRSRGITRTPRAIEQEVVQAVQDREALATIAALRNAGATVEYRVCDVADSGNFGRLLTELQAQYKIDVLLHGAGVIDDAYLCDKSETSFNRVFDTKADSAFTIVDRLEEGRIGQVVFFASTAGRFGNAGQADYAAANELVNRLAWAAQGLAPSTTFRAINWGPWVGAGMVSPAMERNFKEHEIPVITGTQGVQFLRQELAQGAVACEVIFGGGDWVPCSSGVVGKANELAFNLPLTADGSV